MTSISYGACRQCQQQLEQLLLQLLKEADKQPAQDLLSSCCCKAGSADLDMHCDHSQQPAHQLLYAGLCSNQGLRCFMTCQG